MRGQTLVAPLADSPFCSSLGGFEGFWRNLMPINASTSTILECLRLVTLFEAKSMPGETKLRQVRPEIMSVMGSLGYRA